MRSVGFVTIVPVAKRLPAQKQKRSRRTYRTIIGVHRHCAAGAAYEFYGQGLEWM